MERGRGSGAIPRVAREYGRCYNSASPLEARFWAQIMPLICPAAQFRELGLLGRPPVRRSSSHGRTHVGSEPWVANLLFLILLSPRVGIVKEPPPSAPRHVAERFGEP